MSVKYINKIHVINGSVFLVDNCIFLMWLLRSAYEITVYAICTYIVTLNYKHVHI